MSKKVTTTDTERPPILGTWNRFYLVVMITHALLILFFYLITKWYS